MDYRLRRHFQTILSALDQLCHEQPTEHQLIHASVLLRMLFLDGGKSVADRINREARLKLSFDVVAATEHSANDPVVSFAITPGAWAPNSPARRTIGRDAFFGLQIGVVQGEPVIVGDLIRYVAHVGGGAHFGDPDTVVQRLLVDVDEATNGAMGFTISLAPLRSIAFIVRETLTPLERWVRG